MDHAPEKDIDNLLEILDGFCAAEGRRIKLNVSEELASGEAKREYHLGCCDIGSPWAKGTAFDVLKEPEDM